jgi:hypothetical protein
MDRLERQREAEVKQAEQQYATRYFSERASRKAADPWVTLPDDMRREFEERDRLWQLELKEVTKKREAQDKIRLAREEQERRLDALRRK